MIDGDLYMQDRPQRPATFMGIRTRSFYWHAYAAPARSIPSTGSKPQAEYYPRDGWLWGFKYVGPEAPKPPKSPRGTPGPGGSVPVYTSHTPEDKFGPAGSDGPRTVAGSEQRFIEPAGTLPYRVEFWNKQDALVPTQDAMIVDRLDPNVFDVDTFQLTRVGLLKWDLPLPEGTRSIDTRIDLRPDMDLVVEVKAGLGMEVPGFANNDQVDENTLVWWFHAVDPATGDWPEDPMAGFLPPFNPETGYEIGWVEFTVDHKEGLPTGTRIENQAFVEFDYVGDLPQHPAPKEGPWVNTIDTGTPSSRVEMLPATMNQPSFGVQWSGQDETGESGIRAYDVYVSVDGGLFIEWLVGTTATSAVFPGEMGHEYGFISVATDGVGHREAMPPEADTRTSVGLRRWHNYMIQYDVDGNGYVAPLDVLTIISYINANPSSNALPSLQTAPPRYYDVNNNNQCTPLDVLMVVQYINSETLSGEGGADDLAPPMPVPDQAALALPELPVGGHTSQQSSEHSGTQEFGSSADATRDVSPWSTRPVRHSLTYAAGRPSRPENDPARTPDLLPPDAAFAELEDILPDIVEEIDRVWQQS